MRPVASSATTKAQAHPKASLLRHFLGAPLRALSRARDLYVRSLLSCASAVGSGHVACPGGQLEPLPRSFSVGSSRLDGDDDFRELVRAASAKGGLGYSAEDLDAALRQIRKNRPAVGQGARVLPKSCSVGMGRIEEERECDVGDEKERESVRRSRSYAVVDSRGAGF
ncbi:uncharacterized protein LOC115739601 [Rhodamnia argentea]|uniref:Uncharacterized protein LOC115739601 n=1 Tax=Rhodamnia argentea TaxID=178133 RepID=A0A8B8P445_9MYRT|nr:uncharacterized protein LOC115739601 [Rhodamnia argentea]